MQDLQPEDHRVRKLLGLCFLVFCNVCLCWGAASSGLNGRVVDSSGAAISNAEIALTSVATGALFHAQSGPDGLFSITGLAGGAYTLAVSRPDFAAYREKLEIPPNQTSLAVVVMQVGAAAQSVTVNGDVLAGATPQPLQQQVFDSDQTIRVIDRKQMDMAGPVAGTAQIIATSPGASIIGYGNTGATKYTIMLNGINQGWGGYGGFTGGGSLAVTFDGVPVADPATGLWAAPTIPQTKMIQDTAVTYGPGNPADRWYTNIGGGVEFTPVQPVDQPYASVSVLYGSYNQKNIETNMSSGVYHGWSTVLSAGAGSGDDFRISPDGFANPSKDFAVFSKTVKQYQQNSLEFGGYYAHGGGYRSQVIPIAGNPGITVDGDPGSLQYSQQTSGYLSTVPFNSYNKYDTNGMALIYARQDIHPDGTTALENLAWFMRIDRIHYRTKDVFNLGPQQDEWSSPHTNTVGDRLSMTKRLPRNTVTGGAYYIHALYNTRNIFYNPAYGGAKRVVNIGAKIRSGYFNQNLFAFSLQDDVHPLSKLHIIPGLRFAGFQTAYANRAAQDFSLAPGATLSMHCPANQASTAGTATDQGASCANEQSRTGIEPSVSATLAALPWLQIYGGYFEALKSPQVGGGGGLFQAVDPASYHLARQHYYQAGFKTHSGGDGLLNSFLLGAEYYHQNYANQEIDIGLANGDTISSNGTSSYHGVNAFVDDDPVNHLHVFANASLERATYTSYVITLNPNGSKGLNYNGSAVPYVPSSMLNIGVYYGVTLPKHLTVEPTASFQFIGRQHIFDNSIAAPSAQTMPSYETLNLGAKIPFRHFDLNLAALNVLNKRYNEYEYISAGNYFGTAGNPSLKPDEQTGYRLAYPASPFTIYGDVTVHF